MVGQMFVMCDVYIQPQSLHDNGLLNFMTVVSSIKNDPHYRLLVSRPELTCKSNKCISLLLGC